MRINFGITLALSCITLLVLDPLAHADAQLSVLPVDQSIAPGGTFSIDVNVAGVSDLYGYQFDILFDPNVIEALSSMEGTFLAKGGSTFFIPGTNDNVGGTVAATANTLVSSVPGVSGSGNLAILTFEALKTGVSAIAISGVEFTDSSLNSISTSSTGGSVTVGSSRIAAPEIDPASAMSALTLLLGGLTVLRPRSTMQRPKP
jgi:Cohesin domain